MTDTTSRPVPVGALALTILGPLALLLAAPYLLLPGVDAEVMLQIAGSRRKLDSMSIFAVGLVPYITAAIIVEIRSSMPPAEVLARYPERVVYIGGGPPVWAAYAAFIQHWDITRLPYDGPADRWLDPAWLTAAG